MATQPSRSIANAPASAKRRIRVGVGGWTYAPWRGSFFPAGLPHSQELHYASRQLTAIEVNGTYYSTMKPASFKKWHDETPDDFMFTVKASRYATNRKQLASAAESITRFVDSGIAELKAKLGPIVWQFMPTKAFDPEDFAAFLALLPSEVSGRPLRHAMDVRHPSFMCEPYLELARKHEVATVFADSDKFPSFADVTGDFVYGRLMRSSASCESGYPPEQIGEWANCARSWAEGREPHGLPSVLGAQANRKPRPRDVFMFFIAGDKEMAPAAAIALIKKLGKG